MYVPLIKAAPTVSAQMCSALPAMNATTVRTLAVLAITQHLAARIATQPAAEQRAIKFAATYRLAHIAAVVAETSATLDNFA